MKFTQICIAACLCFSLSACDVLTQLPAAGTESASGSNNGKDVLTNQEVSRGIKEALGQGLERSIQGLSIKDGFLGNAAVKIWMPPEAQKVEKTLRGIGLGSLCDEFITNMNRAAESAVKEASPVFVSALSQLTVNDAFNILLSGDQEAATTFFKRTTSDQLAAKFSPIVTKSIGEHQVSRYWKELITRYNQIPLINEKIDTDLTKYVTEKAIDGLFNQVAEEELKIRSNLSGSRTSPLLKKVFGYADQNKQ